MVAVRPENPGPDDFTCVTASVFDFALRRLQPPAGDRHPPRLFPRPHRPTASCSPRRRTRAAPASASATATAAATTSATTASRSSTETSTTRPGTAPACASATPAVGQDPAQPARALLPRPAGGALRRGDAPLRHRGGLRRRRRFRRGHQRPAQPADPVLLRPPPARVRPRVREGGAGQHRGGPQPAQRGQPTGRRCHRTGSSATGRPGFRWETPEVPPSGRPAVNRSSLPVQVLIVEPGEVRSWTLADCGSTAPLAPFKPEPGGQPRAAADPAGAAPGAGVADDCGTAVRGADDPAGAWRRRFLRLRRAPGMEVEGVSRAVNQPGLLGARFRHWACFRRIVE